MEEKGKKVPDKKEALHLLTFYCSKEERCEYDVLQKLKSYEVSESISEEIFKYLRENNYVNNSRYAAAFVNDKFRFNKWGKTKISYALKQKKIASSIIYNALDTIADEDYLQLLKNEIVKKAASTKAASEYEKKSKLFRFAASRGFETDLIMKILGDLEN